MTSDTTAIIGWIRENCFQDAPDKQVAVDTPLLDNGLLDSLQIVQLVGFLETHFGISVDVEEMLPENFETVNTVMALVKRVRGS